MSRSNFALLIKDVVNNLDNKDCQTKINNDNYNLKNAKTFLLKIVTKKISKDEAHKLYGNLIETEVVELKKCNI